MGNYLNLLTFTLGSCLPRPISAECGGRRGGRGGGGGIEGGGSSATFTRLKRNYFFFFERSEALFCLRRAPHLFEGTSPTGGGLIGSCCGCSCCCRCCCCCCGCGCGCGCCCCCFTPTASSPMTAAATGSFPADAVDPGDNCCCG